MRSRDDGASASSAEIGRCCCACWPRLRVAVPGLPAAEDQTADRRLAFASIEDEHVAAAFFSLLGDAPCPRIRTPNDGAVAAAAAVGAATALRF